MQEVEITNKFDKDADFTIEVQMIDKNASASINNQKTRRNSATGENSSQASLLLPVSRLPPAFHVSKKKEKISIKKHQAAKLNIQFLPFEMSDYEANVIFLDPKVGEMQYTLRGNVEMPKDDKNEKSLKTFKQDAGDRKTHAIQLTFENQQFNKAKDACDKRYILSNMSKEREMYGKSLQEITCGT